MSSALPYALMGMVFWSGVFYLGLRFIRTRERSGVDVKEIEELRARVERLEDDLGSATTRLERLGDAQEFTTKLLSDRTRATPGTLPDARS